MKTGKRLPGSKGTVVVQKPLKRGYDFFFWCYIHQVELQQVDGIWYVQSQCWISPQHKSTKYHQKLTFTSSGSQLNVDYASCVPCPVGTNSGLCQHVFALLLVLEKYLPKLAETETGLPSPQSCTSEKKHGDLERDINPKTVMSVMEERAKDSSECKKVAITCTLYEARSNEAKNVTIVEVISFNRSLDNDSRLFSILPGDSAEIDC